MSTDTAFLERIWRVLKNQYSILSSRMVAIMGCLRVSSLIRWMRLGMAFILAQLAYLAALQAGAAMAEEMRTLALRNSAIPL